MVVLYLTYLGVLNGTERNGVVLSQYHDCRITWLYGLLYGFTLDLHQCKDDEMLN